jgi:RES domain-containing protein
LAAVFASWNSFRTFERAVRFNSRFLHDEEVLAFLQAITVTTEKRITTVSPAKALWRAQLGHDWRERAQDDMSWDEPAPFSEVRMKPLRHSAHEGRVNPRGIPCLYVASDKETAVAEVRPWLGALVSVAQMSTSRDLRLVNCTEGHDTNLDFYVEQPEPEIREETVWRNIGRAFSSPVANDPGIAEYVPTQVLAEHFRKQKYDGVAYKSKLGQGFNVALFDLDALEIVDLRLYPVSAVKYEIGELQDSYRVRHSADA